MTRYQDQDEPGVIAEQEEAEEAARLAEGVVHCAGPWCKNWLEPHQVVTSDRGSSYGPCCAVVGAKVDADLVEAVCLTAMARGAVLGRRVSVGPHTPAVRDQSTPDWCVTHRNGSALFTAHDLFEVVRWYCYAESGQMEYDPAAPAYALPADAEIVAREFEERTMYMRRD